MSRMEKLWWPFFVTDCFQDDKFREGADDEYTYSFWLPRRIPGTSKTVVG